jgi:hypothetical protein
MTEEGWGIWVGCFGFRRSLTGLFYEEQGFWILIFWLIEKTSGLELMGYWLIFDLSAHLFLFMGPDNGNCWQWMMKK